jgi:uncharacterized protein YerC
MAQISKRIIRPEIEKRLSALFQETLSGLRNKNEAQLFVEDVLTRTEKVMLAKRVAIAVLLEKNFDYRSIRDLLKVSSSTISTVKEQFQRDGGGYKSIVQRLARAESWKELAEFADSILSYRHRHTLRKVLEEEPPKEEAPF